MSYPAYRRYTRATRANAIGTRSGAYVTINSMSALRSRVPFPTFTLNPNDPVIFDMFRRLAKVRSYTE